MNSWLWCADDEYVICYNATTLVQNLHREEWVLCMWWAFDSYFTIVVVLSTGIHLSRVISDCALQVKAIRDEELHISYDIVYCCMQVVWCSMIMDVTMKVGHGWRPCMELFQGQGEETQIKSNLLNTFYLCNTSSPPLIAKQHLLLILAENMIYH